MLPAGMKNSTGDLILHIQGAWAILPSDVYIWAAVFLHCLEFHCEITILASFGFLPLFEAGFPFSLWLLSLIDTLQAGAVLGRSLQRCGGFPPSTLLICLPFVYIMLIFQPVTFFNNRRKSRY